MWVLRLSLALGCTPAELEERLTAAELVEFQALVEVDGPFWGEREAAQIRQLTSVVAATAGADLPADRFQIEWQLGASGDAGANLLPANDGLEIFAARHGLEVFPLAEEIP